jgi:lipopolysaccharide heptosyltransferase II
MHRLQWACIRTLYAAANGLLEVLRKILWPRKRPETAERVCVYRIGNVGDSVCALPAIAAIRRAYPHAHLTLVTSPGRRGLAGFQELLVGSDLIDDIVTYYSDEIAGFRARLTLVREMRRRAFEVWFQIPHDVGFRISLRNMIVARAAGVRWGYGWRLGTLRIGLRAQAELMRWPNEVDRLMDVVVRAGLPAASPVFPLPLADVDRDRVDRMLNASGIAAHEPLVSIAPGAKRSTNRWPIERFAAIANHLARRGFRIVVLGGPSEEDLCRSVAVAAGDGALSLAGRASLLESCEVLRRSRLLVCNDSGVQHLAAAVGTPVVSIFSSRDMRGKWVPFGRNHAVLSHWIECHTCLVETCPYDNRCIRLIQLEEVIDAAERALGIHETEASRPDASADGPSLAD